MEFSSYPALAYKDKMVKTPENLQDFENKLFA